MKIEFWVMSSKYELETENEILWISAALVFLKTEAPVVFYVLPSWSKIISEVSKFLEENFKSCEENPTEFRKAYDSIKRLV